MIDPTPDDEGRLVLYRPTPGAKPQPGLYLERASGPGRARVLLDAADGSHDVHPIELELLEWMPIGWLPS